MNLGLGTNNLSRQIDEANTSSLDNPREQPVLNIIYEPNKNLDSSGNAIFTPQFADSFDMSQITLQVNFLRIDSRFSNAKRYFDISFYEREITSNRFFRRTMR